jgi:hypothetical protein
MTQQINLDSDPFFRLINNSEWNACIGPQGDEENYVEGYMEAALQLANAVLEKKIHISRDTLILPILYNARHAIELAFKFVMRQLHEAGLLHQAPRGNHKIHEHLKELQAAKIGDYELRQQIGNLSPFVQSLAEIDDDGQQLRYATSQAGQASLENRPLANLLVIRASLQDLSDILKALKRRTYTFCEEYHTGTFTSLCSRSDLMTLAKALAAEPERRGPSYKLLRDEFKTRFGLGNQTFLNAISIIEANREMGSLLGKEFDLKHLTDEKVWFVVACWTKLHPQRDPKEPRIRVLTVTDVMREMRRAPDSGQIVRDLLSGLTTEELIDLETVYYLARDRHFPEAYDRLYERTKREYGGIQDTFQNANDLLNKTNLLKELQRGLTLLGRRSLAAEIWASRPDLH